MGTHDEAQVRDVRVEVKVRNNLILSKMEHRGIESIVELCRRMGMAQRQGEIGSLINMKVAAKNKDGKWRFLAIKLADFFECAPEELFSEFQQEVALEKNRSHAELAFAEIAQLTNRNQGEVGPRVSLEAQELRTALTEALRKLTPREERVLRMRFGFNVEEQTLEEIAVQLGVSKDRVRQIEERALQKLKSPSRSRPILATAMAGKRESEGGGRSIVLDGEILDAL